MANKRVQSIHFEYWDENGNNQERRFNTAEDLFEFLVVNRFYDRIEANRIWDIATIAYGELKK